MVLRALIVFFFLAPFFASAQIIPSVGSVLEVETIPSSVEPGSTVTVRAQVPASMAGSATFVWRVDGRTVDQGIGRNAIQVAVGGAGTRTVVSVNVTEGGVLRAEKTIELAPASVDLVWEGNTYTPPFYHGKPLTTGSSAVTVLAVPNIIQNGARVSSDDLVYRWYVNDAQAPKKSGYGASWFSLTTPQFENEFTVRVVAETRDGSIRTTNEISIKPVRPEIVIYQRSPLLGLRFDQATGASHTMNNGEVTFVAFPLYLTSTEGGEYQWLVDGKDATTSNVDPRSITFRKTVDGVGNFSIAVKYQNPTLLFEYGTQTFNLKF